MTSHRDAFLNAVDTDRGLWQSADVRVIAVHAQGAWHNLITQCYLRSMEPGQVPRLTQEVRSPTLRAEQYILPVAELPSLLTAVESGQWAAGDNAIVYRRGEFDSGPPRPYDLANSHLHSLDLRHVHPDFEWAGQVLHASGDHCSTIVQRVPESWQGLESTVRHQPYPFQCLDDLVSHITGIHVVDTIRRQATFEVFAPYEVRLVEDEAELEDGTVYFALEAGSAAAVAACTLRVLPEPRGAEVPALTVIPEHAHWNQEPDGALTYAGEYPAIGASAVTLVLSCGRQAVRWLRVQPYMVGAAPAPLAVYRLVDPELEILKSWLSGTEKDPQGKFELAVARLFTLSGFQVDPFTGHKRLSEGVDFIAHARRQHTCVAAECTTGGIDGAKLTKFVKRMGEITRTLGDVHLVGLLVTSTPLDDLSTGEIDRALADGLIIVPADGVAALFEMVASGTSVPAVLDFLSRQHIPPGQPTRTLKTKGLDLALTRRRGR